MRTVADMSAWVRDQFPINYAEPWDAVGDVCGRTDAELTGVMLTVDVTASTVAEAQRAGANYILAHHPLLLGGVTSLAPSDYKGEVIHSLIEARMALHVAHTNADIARPGVSDALASALGVVETAPLVSSPGAQLDKLVIFVPRTHAQAVLSAVSEAGAGSVGAYDRCAFLAEGTGTFRPLVGATPHIGEVGRVADVSETRIEMVMPRSARGQVIHALRSAHPYEEPAFDVTELVAMPTDTGLGRIGHLSQPMSLQDFGAVASQVLPVGPAGARVAGDPARIVDRVAVCGGSGDGLMAAAQSGGADVYLTSDLKHHRVQEFVQDNDCAIIDVVHYASEYPWCGQTAAALEHHLAEVGVRLPVTVSSSVTDPWTFRRGAQ